MAIEQQGKGRWKPVRDISRNIGVPLDSFSFFGNRLRRIKSLDLGCGANYRRNFNGYVAQIKKILSILKRTQDLNNGQDESKIQQSPEWLPEVLMHKLEMLKFR